MTKLVKYGTELAFCLLFQAVEMKSILNEEQLSKPLSDSLIRFSYPEAHLCAAFLHFFAYVVNNFSDEFMLFAVKRKNNYHPLH